MLLAESKDEAKKLAGNQDGQVKVKWVDVDVSANPPSYRDNAGNTFSRI